MRMMMKPTVRLVIALFSAVRAFAPLRSTNVVSSRSVASSRIATAVAIVTGPKGKPASSPEEDLFLTLKVIMDHDARSTTVSKEQFIIQMQELRKMPKSVEPVDVSVPYHAAAKLAYDTSDNKALPFDEFMAKYEEDVIQQVKAKKQQQQQSKRTKMSATRRVWSVAKFFWGSLEKLLKLLSKRVFGACQKVIWKLGSG